MLRKPKTANRRKERIAPAPYAKRRQNQHKPTVNERGRVVEEHPKPRVIFSPNFSY
jgi:hypothetical protein